MRKGIVKKNLPLFLVVSVAGLVSLVLLVFVVIQIVQLREYQGRSNKALKDGESLVRRSKVSPGKENEVMIQKDIEVARKAADGLRKQFRNPMQVALDEFFKVLQPPQIGVLSEEQIEAYKVPGTGEEVEENGKTRKVPLKIRRLTQQEFVEFFNAEFDKYCENKYDDERKRNDITVLNNFKRTLYNCFPKGNFEQAMNAFVAKAKTLTCESIGEHNQEALLLYGLGMPRRVSDDPGRQAQIVDSITETIRKNAHAMNLKFEADALKIFGGQFTERGENNTALRAEDYQIALIHADIMGDIFNRIGKVQQASVKVDKDGRASNGIIGQLTRIVPRVAESTEENSSSRSNFNFSGSFENSESGNFLIYHYTIEFHASMDGVRKVLQALDQAYKEDRTYVVRSLCLYANDKGAERVIDEDADKDDKNDPQIEESEYQDSRRRGSRGRGRRRSFSRRREIEPPPPSVSGKDKDVQRGEIDAHLPIHQRRNYGVPLIGNVDPSSECRVFLDIDYIVLSPNRNQ